VQREQVDEAVVELERRLRMYPRDRYPVQHATASFHLGTLLLQRDDAAAARDAFEIAADLFDPAALPVEHAKATNLLGAALRAQGEAVAARTCFESAAAAFRRAGLELEEGAATFNLGLALRDSGDAVGSAVALQRARGLLAADRVPAQAAAAGRELGTSLLAAGDVDGAVAALRSAVELADGARGGAAIGPASNALGLALLAAGDITAAIDALRDAVAADPRALRPEAHAIAKANLALALEAGGRTTRARVTAAQVVAMPEAPDTVVAQARALLERVATTGNDVMRLLHEEPAAGWGAIVREELRRWLDLDHGERVTQARAWVLASVEHPDRAEDIAEAWLTALLEFPPDQMETLIVSALQAVGDIGPAGRDAWHHDVHRAMVRFHIPQWERLRGTFNNLAQALGQDPSWT